MKQRFNFEKITYFHEYGSGLLRILLSLEKNSFNAKNSVYLFSYSSMKFLTFFINILVRAK